VADAVTVDRVDIKPAPENVRGFQGRQFLGVCYVDGCLIIGSTESITGFCPEFEPKRYLRAVFYQFKGT